MAAYPENMSSYTKHQFVKHPVYYYEIEFLIEFKGVC